MCDGIRVMRVEREERTCEIRMLEGLDGRLNIKMRSPLVNEIQYIKCIKY